MNFELFTASIIAAESSLVAVIIVITWKLSVSLRTEDFRWIKLSWSADLIYVILSAVDILLTLSRNHSSILKFSLSTSISFFDVCQFAILLYALSKSQYSFSHKNFIQKIGAWSFVIFAIPLSLNILNSLYPNCIWSIGFIRYSPFNVIGILMNIAVLYLSTSFYRETFLAYRLSSFYIVLGAYIYCLIQGLALFSFTSEPSLVEMIGWTGGLISKAFICYGLIQIFKAEAIKSRRLEKILGSVFHELRNTLYGFDTPVNKMLYERHINIKVEAREIERTYELMASIIDAAWMMYRNDLDQIEEDREIVNINNLVTEKRQLVRINSLIEIAIKIVKNISQNHVTFTVNYGANCQIHCFRHEIVQVVVNLTKNAVEAFEDGFGTIYISTKRQKHPNDEGLEEKCVVLEIFDDGPGILPEVQERIFDFGFTTKGDRAGSGIGLAVVKEIVERNNGTIKMESPIKLRKKTGGTKFTITFMD